MPIEDEKAPKRKVIHLYDDYQMFLRDEFAKTAMLGILSHGLKAKVDQMDDAFDALAEYSYRAAEAMLRQREKLNEISKT